MKYVPKDNGFFAKFYLYLNYVTPVMASLYIIRAKLDFNPILQLSSTNY